MRGQYFQAKTNGFTIVELLIVVVVIAILAAITIVSYNGITSRSHQAAVQSAAAQAAKKISAEAIINSETYPADISGLGLTNTNGTTYQYTVNNDSNPKGYCLTATSNGFSAYIARSFIYNGGTSVNQDSPTSGMCPGHSSSGGEIITNLIPNPSLEVVGTNGWVASGANVSIALSTTSPTNGLNSLRVSSASSTNSGDVRLSTGTYTSFPAGMEAGKTYTVSARVTMPAAPTGNYGRGPGVLLWQSINGTSWTEVFGPKAPAVVGTHTVSHTFTLPANATGALLGFGVASATVNQSFYYDSFMLTEGSTVHNYADGNSPGWVWTGAAGNSSSRGPVQ